MCDALRLYFRPEDASITSQNHYLYFSLIFAPVAELADALDLCATVLACVQEMKPYLIGKDPMRIEDFSAVLYRAGFYRGGGVLMSAIAGIDQVVTPVR